ncbi:MAG: sigma-54 dependent transcriptional regulator [Haliangiales bacterium]
MSRGAKVLLVDDDPAVLRGVSALLGDEGYRCVSARSANAARAALTDDRDPPAVMLLDIRMPEETGLELLERLPRPLPLPVVVLSGEASISDTVQALKLGAIDFIEKPPSAERLLTALKNALTLSELADERERLRSELAKPGHLVGDSAAMVALRQTVAQIGPKSAIILIRGETGSGKERVARALHLASGRRGRFVAVNCAAIPAQLLESELFGYERGAFSGATARRIGRIEQAQGGTLLLDEIGDMPQPLQSKLLRVLEEREIERLGSDGPVAIDVRFLAATHRDLEQAVADDEFRQDLFYRLNVFPLQVPPLRERSDDIVPLARAFAAELAGAEVALSLDPEAAADLERYAWPGNVRELRNFVERMSLLRGRGPLRIEPADVAALVGGASPTASPSAPTELDQLGEKSYRELVEGFERRLLRRALDQADGNVAEAARLLRVDRGNLYRRIKALGVEPEPDRKP